MKRGAAIKMNAAMRANPTLVSDPEWERMKAARRSISHHDAIQESDYLQKQFRAFWRHRMRPSPVDLNEVLQTLTSKKIRFVLTGAYAIGGWTGRPRSTHDVDILVKAGRTHARAVKAIRELYPELEVHKLPKLTAFFVPGETESVIDVAYPYRPDNEETLNNPVWVKSDSGLKYRIPSLEAALANKYGAMVAVGRDAGKRAQDTVDFYWMVRHSFDAGQKPIDLRKLATLGEMVWPGGGGEEILRLVTEAKEGGVPQIGGLGSGAHSP